VTPADEATIGVACAQCGATLEARELTCASCGALKHAAELERLAAEAQAAQSRRDWPVARKAWADALALLPPGTVQYRSVDLRLQEIDRLLRQEMPGPGKKSPMAKWATRLGPLGAALWKAKLVGLVILSKAKLILLGLTKLGTLASMGASFLLYWTLYGWRFAAGLVMSIFIHEMGHVLELKKFGIAASAPMFIPGFGAVVMLKQRPATVGQDARVGLAGPIFGLGAAVFAYAVYLSTGEPLWAALTRFGAWINLFNLIPVWQLDGGRGFAALTRQQRGVVLTIAAGLWFWTNDGLLLLVALGATYRLFTKDYPASADGTVLWRYAGLLAALGWLCTVGSGNLPKQNAPANARPVAAITSVWRASDTPRGNAGSRAAVAGPASHRLD
jgi:Zn-dependent protease